MSCVARAVSTVVVGALMRSEVQHKAGQRAEEAINCSYHVASGCEGFASSTFIILFFAYQSIFFLFSCSPSNVALSLHPVKNPRDPQFPYLACKL